MEFTAAAYRFAHSMIRNAYRLNSNDDFFPIRIFNGKDNSQRSLVGFGELDAHHQVNWRLLLPDPANPDTLPGKAPENNQDGPKRLQFAYKLDTNIVNPLLVLPPRIADAPDPFRALAARNLMRGYNFGLPSGQDVAAAFEIPCLCADDLVIRTPSGWKAFADIPGIDAESAAALTAATPLWLYVLMEAQQGIRRETGFDDESHAGETTALGDVGGRILLEVFHGILEADTQSVVADPAAECWQPLAHPDRATLTLWHILQYAGEID